MGVALLVGVAVGGTGVVVLVGVPVAGREVAVPVLVAGRGVAVGRCTGVFVGRAWVVRVAVGDGRGLAEGIGAAREEPSMIMALKTTDSMIKRQRMMVKLSSLLLMVNIL